MSVIVGIKHNGKVYLGADSQVSSGNNKSYLHNINNYKLWKVKNSDHCLMGSVGFVRDACVIRLIDDLIDELAAMKNEINFEYVVKSIVPHIFSTMKSYNYMKEDDTRIDSAFLFAYQDKLYYIQGDGCVLEINDFIAIGSGQENAFGSLEATKQSKNVKERIIKAIEAATEHNLYVSGDIIIGDTDKCQIQEV